MIKSIWGILAGILLFAGSALATGPLVPAKGVYCWMPNAETDLAGYRLYITNPANVVTVIDAGKITAAPVPPTPKQACPAGTVGILRDQMGQPDGQYSMALLAYDTAGNESGKAVDFPFVLDGTAPIVPSGNVVK